MRVGGGVRQVWQKEAVLHLVQRRQAACRQGAELALPVCRSAPDTCAVSACSCHLQCQLAIKAGKFYTSVTNVAIWGNHSTTQVGAGGAVCGHLCRVLLLQLAAAVRLPSRPCVMPVYTLHVILPACFCTPP